MNRKTRKTKKTRGALEINQRFFSVKRKNRWLFYRLSSCAYQPVWKSEGACLCHYYRTRIKQAKTFFNTLFPAALRCFVCAWFENAPINQVRWQWMDYLPLFLYKIRCNIEVSYYEQKKF